MEASAIIQMIRSGHVDATASISAPHKPGWNPITGEPTFAANLPAVAQAPVYAPHSVPPPYVNPAPAAYAAPASQPYPAAVSYPGVAPASRAQLARPMVPDGKGLRIAGWILLGVAAFFALITVLMAIDHENSGTGWMGGIMMMLMFGIPGTLLMWRGRKAQNKSQLVGFLTSRDRIEVKEVARMTGRPELETEQLLAQLNAELRLDLVYVPDERKYVHRSRLSTTHQIPDKCPTCGAPTENQLVLQGERVMCKYCDAPVG